MPKKHEFTNISTNNSSALVAPQRSEIRTFVSEVSQSVVNFYRRNTLTISFLLTLLMATLYVLGVQLPWYAATALVLATAYSVFRGFLVIMVGMKDCPRDMQ